MEKPYEQKSEQSLQGFSFQYGGVAGFVFLSLILFFFSFFQRIYSRNELTDF